MAWSPPGRMVSYRLSGRETKRQRTRWWCPEYWWNVWTREDREVGQSIWAEPHILVTFWYSFYHLFRSIGAELAPWADWGCGDRTTTVVHGDKWCLCTVTDLITDAFMHQAVQIHEEKERPFRWVKKSVAAFLCISEVIYIINPSNQSRWVSRV